MSAITIRNLPETVHDGLRKIAASDNLSVEALVRNLLAAAAADGAKTTEATGMSEAPLPWGASPAGAQSMRELWGALKGCVQVPPETDLSAPAETWEAAR
jgi:hypothetical protein